MTGFIGLYRELKENEHAIIENGILAPIVFVKEVEFKKFLGRQKRDLPVSCLLANVYLTNKRLMLLVLHEIEALVLKKKGIPSLVGVEGSWYEIPISAITNVEATQKELRKDKEFRKLIPSLANQEVVSLIEVSYIGHKTGGNLKEYIESIFDIDGIAKIFNVKNIVDVTSKIQIIGERTVSLVPKLKGIWSSST